MNAIISGLGVLIKVLAWILGALFAFGILMGVAFSWSDSNKEMASYECVVRRMDHKIADSSTASYHDTCMASKGYRAVGRCYSGSLIANPPFCYAPGWMFWR